MGWRARQNNTEKGWSERKHSTLLCVCRYTKHDQLPKTPDCYPRQQWGNVNPSSFLEQLLNGILLEKWEKRKIKCSNKNILILIILKVQLMIGFVICKPAGSSTVFFHLFFTYIYCPLMLPGYFCWSTGNFKKVPELFNPTASWTVPSSPEKTNSASSGQS